MKVGDYVRTKNGIAKITSIDGVEEVAYTDNKNIVFGIEEQRIMEVSQFTEKYVDSYYKPNDLLYVLNYSSNIIDLIEEGDFVKIEFFSNRYLKRLERIFEVDYVINKSICFENGHCQLNILDRKWSNQDEELKPIIKSIVTKEQFESMEYKV